MAQSYSIKGNNFQGLILLWALGEAGLGGLIHATGVPVTGLFVGGWAAVCLCLMAYRGAKGADFIQALAQVLIIKAIAAPHSPLPAYLAVSFQGLLAAIIFGRIPWKVSVMIFPVLTMMESATQKLITVTLFFGQPFWDGIQAMSEKIAQGLGFSIGEDTILWVAISWIVLHGIFGLGISIWILRLPNKLSQLIHESPLIPSDSEFSISPKSKTILGGSLLVLVPLIVLFFLPTEQALYGILRAWIALLLWFTLGTWFTKKVQIWLTKRQGSNHTKINGILGQLPYFRKLAIAAWQRSGSRYTGLNRWSFTAMLLLKEGLDLHKTLPYEQ